MRLRLFFLAILFLPVSVQAEDCIGKGLDGIELERCLQEETEAQTPSSERQVDVTASIEYPTRITEIEL